MKNRIEYFFFFLFSLIFSVFGTKASRKAAGLLTLIVFYIVPIRKKVVLENLAMAFPEYNEQRIRKIAFECYKSFIITLIEILSMRNLTREEIENTVKVDNKEIIIRKYKEGKGVILLSAHLGNWEYVAASVSAQVNIPVHIIVKSQRNPHVNEWMNKTRTKWINHIVPLGLSVRQIYRQLLEKRMIAMIADQRGPIEGIKLDFFGRKTSVFSGPAALAVKSGAPIIYGIAVRQPDYSYCAQMFEIDMKNLPENEEEKIVEITKRHIAYLEEVIRRYPEQWLWMHKRWKH